MVKHVSIMFKSVQTMFKLVSIMFKSILGSMGPSMDPCMDPSMDPWTDLCMDPYMDHAWVGGSLGEQRPTPSLPPFPWTTPGFGKVGLLDM